MIAIIVALAAIAAAVIVLWLIVKAESDATELGNELVHNRIRRVHDRLDRQESRCALRTELAALRAQLQQLEVRTLPDAIDRLEAYYKAHPGEHEMYVAGEAVGYTNKGVIRADHSRLAKQGAIEAVGGGVYRRGAA